MSSVVNDKPSVSVMLNNIVLIQTSIITNCTQVCEPHQIRGKTISRLSTDTRTHTHTCTHVHTGAHTHMQSSQTIFAKLDWILPSTYTVLGIGHPSIICIFVHATPSSFIKHSKTTYANADLFLKIYYRKLPGIVHCVKYSSVSAVSLD